MLSMENKLEKLQFNKEDRYRYAVKEGDNVVPVEDVGKQIGTQAFTERGIWIEGKLPEKKRVFKQSRDFQKGSVGILGRQKKVKESRELETSNKTYPLQKLNYTPSDWGFFQYIMSKWGDQGNLNSKGYLVITNLSEVARELSDKGHLTTPERIKISIRNMSYAYPFITTIHKGRSKRRIEREFRQLCVVKIRQTINNGSSIGEGWITFKELVELDKLPFDEVWIKPCRWIRHGVGKNSYGRELSPEVKKRVEGTGSIFLTEDVRKLSYLISKRALELFNYLSTNTPISRISYPALLEYLAVRDVEIKRKGKKKIQEELANAFNELKEIGELRYWSYSKTNEMYQWEYIGKYIKHKEIVKRDTGKGSKKEKDTPKNTPKDDDTSGGNTPISDEVVSKVQKGLKKGYPIPLKDIEDRKAVKDLITLFSKRDMYEDNWMDDDWETNANNFLGEYIEKTEERYLVRSIEKLNEKIKGWRAWRGKM